MTISIHPILIPENSHTRLELVGVTPNQDYLLQLNPVAQWGILSEFNTSASGEGRITWDIEATWSGEALVDLYPAHSERAAATLHIFAAPAEIAHRRPLRADFHIHTLFSDGHSTPAEMVIRGRELGLDALAITDHNRFEPSVEGIEAAHHHGLGLLAFTGEEITAWDWHLVAIGTSSEVQPEEPGHNGLVKALERVHALGGKGYLAHPYWIGSRQRNMPSADYDRILAEGGLDGIELLGDVEWEENLLSVARYFELDPTRRPPALGNSDTHWAEHTFGGYWSLVLAEKPDQASLLKAIAEHYSVACARLPANPAARKLENQVLAYGAFKLVELALFLERYYFPEHDRLCRLEAGLAWRQLAGENLPPSAMTQAVAAVEAHADFCFG